MVTYTACGGSGTGSKNQNTDKEKPAEWFTAEVLSEYKAVGYEQPEQTNITDNWFGTQVHLEGNLDTIFMDFTKYTYDILVRNNGAVYEPEFGVTDGRAAFTGFKRMTAYKGTPIDPDCGVTSVTFFYPVGEKIYTCGLSVSLNLDEEGKPSGGRNMYVQFRDATDDKAYAGLSFEK